MYLYIYQSDVIFSKVEFKLIGDGLKVTKEAEPGYLDAFSESTMLNYSGAHITTTFIHSSLNENRHMTVKVGKISNKTILSNLKNDMGTGLQQPSNFFWYVNANDTLGITNDKLADNGYYYLYVVGDTENGKYITQEGITFAQASVYSENQDRAWYMFFYGSGDFKWNISDGGSDPTVVTDKTLPQTGITHPFIAASTISLVILTVIAYTYTKRNRDIR